MPRASESPPPDGDAEPIRVGDVGAGPAAFVGRGGVVGPLSAAGRDWSVEWWIGSEDRWHLPSSEPSCRRRLVDATPVVETTIKVPGGDATARCYGAVFAGSDHRGVVIDVSNASAVPFAVAFTVVSREPMTTDGSTVWIDGTAVLRLVKGAARFGSSDDVESLRVELDAERFVDRPETAVMGALALIVPLPHTASTLAVVDPRPAVRSRRRGVPEQSELAIERASVPSAEQVAAGWTAFCRSGVRLELADDALAATFDAARADVLMGPEATADAAELAAIATATARLGRLDEIGELVEVLLDGQKLDGRIDSADPIDATRRFLALVAALWSGGIDAGQVDALVGPIAKAGHWLGHGRRRPAIDAGSSRATGVAHALWSIIPALVSIGQPDVAEEFSRIAATISGPNAMVGSTTSARGVAHSADLVIARLDATVAETSDGLALFATWTPTSAGLSLEAHGVPTRWGVASCALRWHGERPALLWEVTPYPDRAVSADVPRWMTPSLDAGWSSNLLEGEALLAAPLIPDFS